MGSWKRGCHGNGYTAHSSNWKRAHRHIGRSGDRHSSTRVRRRSFRNVGNGSSIDGSRPTCTPSRPLEILNVMAVPPQPPDWHLTETYKSLITLTVEALKMLALINGGAAIAILTYVGNLVSRQQGHLPDIKVALWSYSGGVAATTLAFIFAYVTQLRLFIEERDRRGGRHRRTLHWVWLTVGILLALGALGAFVFGSVSGATAILTD
jgi:hypothetical protein